MSQIIFLVSLLLLNNINANEFCEANSGESICNEEKRIFFSSKNRRYILYDVNPAEGFNLRRDVYIRVATLVHHLRNNYKEYDWQLVLPPWGNLYHWQSTDVGLQKMIPWQYFFDLTSLKKYIPVLEMFEFIQEYPKKNATTVLDRVFYLQNDEEMFKTGNFEDKNVIKNCPKTQFSYNISPNGNYHGYFWGYRNITSEKVECIVFHGTTYNLIENLKPQLFKSFMFDHMEIPLHPEYGSIEYWRARRSMQYNHELHEIANQYRHMYLNSTDENDNIVRTPDWRLQKENRMIKGGSYLSAHFRRRDFLYGHPESTPSVKDAATQISRILDALNLKMVFIATDADEIEYNQLQKELKNYLVFRYVPSKEVKSKYKDGGISIIDQIICSSAKYFIGTFESTFTFRIQEDREILGFPADFTFNTFCGKKCFKSNKWKVIWN